MATKTILVVVDPTNPNAAAIERAAELALALPADLELFVCHYDPDIAAGQFSTVWLANAGVDGLMKILAHQLEELARPLRERGINVTIDLIWDHPLDEAIVRKVKAARPWIVVKDTHHHSVLRRTILSNTDWTLIRRCPVPLMFVKLDRSIPPRKVAAAIDPTHEHDKPAELDDGIFRLAHTLARATDAALHVVHTYAVKTEPVGLEASPVGRLSESIRQAHEQAVDTFLTNHVIARENTHVLTGLAHDRLVDFAAQEGIGLMVMGAISRRGLDRIFIGSTAERVLDRLPCDLVIVKPDQVNAALSAAT